VNGLVENIDDAIDEYAQRTSAGDKTSAPPYDPASLAEIYGPRVRELLDLQTAGFTRAVWKFDHAVGYNHWHGVD